MITDHPTTTLFFVFAFTFCKVQVYEKDVDLAKALLECAEGAQLLDEEPASAQNIDTRLLFTLLSAALPTAIEKMIVKTKKGIGESLANLGVEPRQ